MRVGLHIGQLLQPVPGGIGRYVAHLARNLPAADVDVTPFGAGKPSPRLESLVGPTVDLGWPHGSLRYELWHRLRRPPIDLDVDVIHAPSLAVPAVRDIPLVVTVHDIAFLREPEAFTRRGLAFHRRGLEIAHAEAAVIVTASRFARDELIDVGFDRDRIHLAPHGVEMRPPEPEARMRERLGRLGLERPYVVAVGTVEPRKGLDTLATALCEARRSVPDLELAIVGPTGWLAVPGLEAPGIHRIGTIDERSLDAVYRHAVACAVASRYEGFGLPALEAMARGCPVIATNATSLPEVVGSAGTLVPLGDVEAWAHALVTTVRDGDLRAEMRRRGIERAAGFTWSGSAHAHAAAYESALDPGAAPRAHT
jgi:glycosyltransferase involved in cell wall biosynthesis